MLSPRDKLMLLEKCFFFNEFVAGRRTKDSFLRELDRFSSNLIGDGFSQNDLSEIKERVGRLIVIKGVAIDKERIIPGLQKTIKIGRVRVIGDKEISKFLVEPWKLDIQTFVDEVRNYIYTSMNNGIVPRRPGFLRNPGGAFLSNPELSFLCAALNLHNSAFLFDIRRQHCLFIVEVVPPSKIKYLGIRVPGKLRLYDPMNENVQVKPLQQVIDGEISMQGDIVVLSPDLERRYKDERAGNIQRRPYHNSMFLSDIHYIVKEDFIKRLGRIQFNACDCVPLSLYAAIQSQH